MRLLLGGGAPSLVVLSSLVFGFFMLLFPPVGLLFILLVPVSLLVALGVNGYYVSVVRETYAGNDEPPAVEDWQALLVDGGYSVLIGLLYMVPVVVVVVALTVVSFVLVGGGAAMGGSGAESAFAALGLVSILVFGVASVAAMVYSLVITYLYPISVCIYADTGEVRDCFSTERLLAVGKTEEYAISWLIQVGVLFAIQMFVGMLTVILIGYLLYPLLPFAAFFVTTAAFYMFAQTYDERVLASGTGTDGDGPSPAGTVEERSG